MKSKEKILWLRELSCGHTRPTNLAFMVEVYDKPKVGDDCFCRECNQEVEIIRVTKEEKLK